MLAGISVVQSKSPAYPLDIIRTRMTLDHYMTTNYNSYFKCARNIFLNEGMMAFYKGYPITGITYPYVGLQFFLYEMFRSDYSYFGGAFAGIIAQTLMYPGDVMRKQLQINVIDNTKKNIMD